jgi:hypothetical protein
MSAKSSTVISEMVVPQEFMAKRACYIKK